MTEEARNSITMRALMQGIKCWDKDIRRYVNSEDIEQYDPLNEFLENWACVATDTQSARSNTSNLLFFISFVF